MMKEGMSLTEARTSLHHLFQWVPRCQLAGVLIYSLLLHKTSTFSYLTT